MHSNTIQDFNYKHVHVHLLFKLDIQLVKIIQIFNIKQNILFPSEHHVNLSRRCTLLIELFSISAVVVNAMV